MRLYILLCALIAIFSGLHSNKAVAQSVYKCSDKRGNPIYGDKPCKGVTGVEAEVKITPPPSNGPSITDSAKIEELRKRWDTDKLTSGIKKAERDIVRFQRAMNKKLANLEEQQKYAANNLAGAHYHSGLSTKMQAVTQKYNTLIEGRREIIKRNQDKLDKMAKEE